MTVVEIVGIIWILLMPISLLMSLNECRWINRKYQHLDAVTTADTVFSSIVSILGPFNIAILIVRRIAR